MYKVKTAPTTYPISTADLSEVKLHCRVSGSAEDQWLINTIKAVTNLVENYLNRQLITATWYKYTDKFETEMLIDKNPVQSIVAITYTDEDGNTQTLDSSYYLLDKIQEPARLTEAYNKSWPDTRTINNAVRIEFTAGYGAASAVPSGIKTAMLFAIMHFYRNRGDEGHRTLPRAFFDMLDQYRVKHYA